MSFPATLIAMRPSWGTLFSAIFNLPIIFILETNSLPSLEENGIVETGLESVGSSMREFLRHVVEEAAK